jgi:hypothetical protein
MLVRQDTYNLEHFLESVILVTLEKMLSSPSQKNSCHIDILNQVSFCPFLTRCAWRV